MFTTFRMTKRAFLNIYKQDFLKVKKLPRIAEPFRLKKLVFCVTLISEQALRFKPKDKINKRRQVTLSILTKLLT